VHSKKLRTLKPTLPSATGCTTGGSNPGIAKKFFSTPDVQTGCGPHPGSCSVGTALLSRGKKQPGREVNHSCPCSAEVKSDWNFALAPSVFHHGVDRDSFTFTVQEHRLHSH
jgi:hypothetical protein